MKSTTQIIINDSTAIIERGKKRNEMFLADPLEVKCVNTTQPQKDSCHIIVKISANAYDHIGDKLCVLVNPNNNRFSEIIMVKDSTLPESQILITRFLEKQLKAKINDTLYICKERKAAFKNLRVQRLSDIFDDNVMVSEDFDTSVVEGFGIIEVVNYETNDSFFIKTNHLKVDSSLKPGTIRLNRKQRIMLSDDLPARLSDEQWNRVTAYLRGIKRLEGNNAPTTEEILKAVNKEEISVDEEKVIKQIKNGIEPLEKNLELVYEKDRIGRVLSNNIDDLEFQHKDSVQKLFRYSLEISIMIRPVLESFGLELKKSLKRIISDFFVGRSTMSLECRRPYDNDENSNIVRISKENMKRLGIDETDQVIIGYKDREISCRVLSIEDEKEFLKTNLYTPIELAIGIPAHIRDQLDIIDIQSAVKVDRDTWFLLKKSANEQLMPLLLAVFSINVFVTELWQYLIVFVLLAPVIVFINLSSKRNMRTENIKRKYKKEED